MSFSITASNQHGPIKLVRPTAREAFELAMTYRRKGYGEIRVTNTHTGETFVEQEIIDNRLPADSTDKL